MNSDNDRRISTAKKMLKARGARGVDPYDNRANLTDMLTDLRHWADAMCIDFHRCSDLSYNHYLEEKANRK